MARKKRFVVGDEDDFQQLLKEGKIEIVCKPGPTFEERFEGLQTLSRRFWDSPIDDTHTRMLALGWWHGYPMFYGGIVTLPKHTTSQREMLLALTNAVHELAVGFLVRLGVKHGIDAGALWAAGSLCRELFQHQDLWNIDAKSRSSPNWPDCLGRSRYALSREECLIIREGEDAFRRLLIQPQAARDAAPGNGSAERKTGKWEHLWKLIQKHGAEKGLGTDQTIANEYNKLTGGKCGKITASRVAQVRYECTHRDRHRK